MNALSYCILHWDQNSLKCFFFGVSPKTSSTRHKTSRTNTLVCWQTPLIHMTKVLRFQHLQRPLTRPLQWPASPKSGGRYIVHTFLSHESYLEIHFSIISHASIMQFFEAPQVDSMTKLSSTFAAKCFTDPMCFFWHVNVTATPCHLLPSALPCNAFFPHSRAGCTNAPVMKEAAPWVMIPGRIPLQTLNSVEVHWKPGIPTELPFLTCEFKDHDRTSLLNIV